MRFHFRELTANDFPRITDFLASAKSRTYPTEVVTRWWPLLLKADSLKCVIVERNSGEIVSLGASVFVEDSFARDVVTGTGPLVGARIMASLGAAGSPVATTESIGRANAGSGLNVFILHSGVIEVPLSYRSEIAAIKVQLMTGFVTLHAGYNIHRLLVEAFGEEERRCISRAVRFGCSTTTSTNTIRRGAVTTSISVSA